jgi:hypothetical protein
VRSVVWLGKRLAALEAKAPQSCWDLNGLPDAEVDELARVIKGLEESGRDLDALSQADFSFLLSVQDRCWLAVRP